LFPKCHLMLLIIHLLLLLCHLPNSDVSLYVIFAIKN